MNQQKNYANPYTSEALGRTYLTWCFMPFLSQEKKKKIRESFPKSTMCIRRKELRKLGVWSAEKKGEQSFPNCFAPLLLATEIKQAVFPHKQKKQWEQTTLLIFQAKMNVLLTSFNLEDIANYIDLIFGKLSLKNVLLGLYFLAYSIPISAKDIKAMNALNETSAIICKTSNIRKQKRKWTAFLKKIDKIRQE